MPYAFIAPLALDDGDGETNAASALAEEDAVWLGPPDGRAPDAREVDWLADGDEVDCCNVEG